MSDFTVEDDVSEGVAQLEDERNGQKDLSTGFISQKESGKCPSQDAPSESDDSEYDSAGSGRKSTTGLAALIGLDKIEITESHECCKALKLSLDKLILEIESERHVYNDKFSNCTQNIIKLDQALVDEKYSVQKNASELNQLNERVTYNLDVIYGKCDRSEQIGQQVIKETRDSYKVMDSIRDEIAAKINRLEKLFESVNESLAVQLSKKPLMSDPSKIKIPVYIPDPKNSQLPGGISAGIENSFSSTKNSGSNSNDSKSDLVQLCKMVIKSPPPKYSRFDSRDFSDFIQKLKEYCVQYNREDSRSMMDELGKGLDDYYMKLYRECLESAMTFEETAAIMDGEIQEERKRIPAHYITMFEELKLTNTSLTMHCGKIESTGRRYMQAKSLPDTQADKLFCDKLRTTIGDKAELFVERTTYCSRCSTKLRTRLR